MSKLKRYILDGREIREEPDLVVWRRWFATTNLLIAQTEVTSGLLVSTVFLGEDQRLFGSGPPILFETLVFGDCCATGEKRRYCTWAEAEGGHMEVVKDIQRELSGGDQT